MSFTALIRRDPTFRAFGTLLPVATFMTLVGIGLLAAFLKEGGRFASSQAATTAVALILWAGTAFVLFFGRAERRCQDLDLTLPLPARRLWLAHQITLSGTTLLVMAATGLVGLPLMALGADAEKFERLDVDMGVLILHLTSAVLLAVAVVQSLRPSRQDAPAGRQHIATTALVFVGVGGLMALLMTLPAYCAVLPLVAAFVIGRRTWSSLPPSFLMIGREITAAPALSEAEQRRFADVESRARPTAWNTHRMILRSFVMTRAAWITLAITLLYGIFTADGAQAFFESELRYVFLPLMVYMLLSMAPIVLAQMSFVDSLPVRRRNLFAYLILPSLAMLVLGYGIVELGLKDRASERLRFEYVQSLDHYRIEFPDRFWKKYDASQAAVPQVQAPWGESFEAFDDKIMKGFATRLYSPYPTPRESSVKYVAWQLSRAYEDIYGQAIVASEIETRLRMGENGYVVPREGGLAFLDDPRPRGPVGVLIYGVTLTAWFLLLALLLRSYRAGISDRRRKATLSTMLVALMGSMLLETGLAAANLFEPDMAVRMLEMRMMTLGEQPAFVTAMWLVCLLAVAVSVFWAWRAFEHIEIEPSRAASSCELP